MSKSQNKTSAPLRPLPSLIFASRWLQLPLYLGLILAQAVYVFHFWVELVHLVENNHTPQFWTILSVQVPNYQKAKDWLKKKWAFVRSGFLI